MVFTHTRDDLAIVRELAKQFECADASRRVEIDEDVIENERGSLDIREKLKQCVSRESARWAPTPA